MTNVNTQKKKNNNTFNKKNTTMKSKKKMDIGYNATQEIDKSSWHNNNNKKVN